MTQKPSRMILVMFLVLMKPCLPVADVNFPLLTFALVLFYAFLFSSMSMYLF